MANTQVVKTSTNGVATPTKVVPNNLEMSYAEELGKVSAPVPDQIFIVESFIRKNLRSLDKNVVPEVQKEISFWLKKYPASNVLHVFQFPKGTRKTEAEMAFALQCQLVKGGKGVCFYEHDPRQDGVAFENQLTVFEKQTKDVAKYVVLEMEAKDLAEKIAVALARGLKDFILVAGEYDNITLWASIVNKVQKEGGTVGVLFPTRMHRVTNESYLKKGIAAQADYIFHGRRKPWKAGKVRYLDAADLVYKLGKDIADDDLTNQLATMPKKKHYKLSRVLAIDAANLFAKTNVVKKTI